MRTMLTLAATLCALAGFTAAPPSGGILFARGSNVPLAVQAFAWRVIETRCDFQRHELGQRSFWAHDVRASPVDGAVVYSIKIVSDLGWKRTEPPATVEMILAAEGGRLRLEALHSSFVTCRL